MASYLAVAVGLVLFAMLIVAGVWKYIEGAARFAEQLP